MAWTWATKAQVITKRPCKIHGITVTPSAVNAECTFYDGESSLEPVIVNLFSSVKVSWPHCFSKPIVTKRGLYVGSFKFITGILINWEPIGEGKA